MNDTTRNSENQVGVERCRRDAGTHSATPGPVPGSGVTSTSVSERVAERLCELSLLEANWDGYGAEPLSPEILAAATEFARWMSIETRFAAEQEPTITPMTGGRLQFEWHHGPRSLELEFESPTEIHYLQWDSEAGLENEDVIPLADREAIAELMGWFAEG